MDSLNGFSLGICIGLIAGILLGEFLAWVCGRWMVVELPCKCEECQADSLRKSGDMAKLFWIDPRKEHHGN